MKTVITITIDTELEVCTVEEQNAEPVTYECSDDSYESIAYDVAEAVSDYLQGLEGSL